MPTDPPLKWWAIITPSLRDEEVKNPILFDTHGNPEKIEMSLLLPTMNGYASRCCTVTFVVL
jgi:hypothetical protein